MKRIRNEDLEVGDFMNLGMEIGVRRVTAIEKYIGPLSDIIFAIARFSGPISGISLEIGGDIDVE